MNPVIFYRPKNEYLIPLQLSNLIQINAVNLF